MPTNAWVKFFGIDNQYFQQVRTKEIFALVEHGFDYSSLMKMPIVERRYYFMMLVKRAQENNQPKPQQNNGSFQNKK